MYICVLIPTKALVVLPCALSVMYAHTTIFLTVHTYRQIFSLCAGGTSCGRSRCASARGRGPPIRLRPRPARATRPRRWRLRWPSRLSRRSRPPHPRTRLHSPASPGVGRAERPVNSVLCKCGEGGRAARPLGEAAVRLRATA